MVYRVYMYVYSCFEKVVARNVHATILKGNMGYDQYTVRNDWSCQTYFCCFPWVFVNICLWLPVPFFQISLKDSALKATHNTFSGLSRALFPTTLIEIAVYLKPAISQHHKHYWYCVKSSSFFHAMILWNMIKVILRE